jgi:hypothetical protein
MIFKTTPVVQDMFVSDCINIILFSIGLFIIICFLNWYIKQRNKDELKIICHPEDTPGSLEDDND